MIKIKENVPKKVSLEGFISFVDSKKGHYDFFDNRNCAFGQYLKSLRYRNVSVGGDRYTLNSKEAGHATYYSMHFIHGGLASAISGKSVDYRDIKYTFEELSKRLKECCL